MSLPARRPPKRRRPARRQRGVATLVVVMVLFFILSMVAAYTSRNLIFEQRTSANQYRSTQAFEAAEAGVEWTLAMLNGGRIDADCRPSLDPADRTFRDRYFQPIAANGALALRVRSNGEPLMPACAFDAASNQWQCRCPTDAAASVPDIAGTAARPMFRIRFEFIPLAESSRRDVVRIVSAGCTRPDAACLTSTPSAPAGDAMAVITQLVALKSGLTTPPGAAVTARGDVDAGAGPLRVANADLATSGITLVAGGAVLGNVEPTSLPGTPGGESVAQGDASLAALAPVAALGVGERMFSTVFGATPGVYRQQPAAVTLDCSTACSAGAVSAAAAANPGRVLWLEGDLLVDDDIGTLANPALMVVTGQARLASGTVFGLVYSRAASWDRGAGTALVRGAIVAEGSLSGSGSQSIVYDAELLNRLRTRHGSFVRVPGGWRDF